MIPVLCSAPLIGWQFLEIEEEKNVDENLPLSLNIHTELHAPQSRPLQVLRIMI